MSLSLASGLLFATVADAQINRSRNPGGGGSSSGGSSDKSSDKGSEKSGGSSSGGSSRSSDSGSSRSSGGSGGSSSGSSERTRTPPERGSSSSSGSGSGSRSGGGSDSGSSSGGGIFNRSRNSGNGGHSSDSGSGSTRSSGGVSSGGSRSSGGSSRSDSGSGSGSVADRLNNRYGSGSNNNNGARGSWSNSREASSGRLAPFSYNNAARSRSNVPNNYDRFLQSREGYNYRYKNGGYGRSDLYVYNNNGWGRNYFVNSAAYYPYYRPGFIAGVTCYSPYAYYWGFYPSYINLSSVYYSPPPVVYVPYPVYTDTGRWRGFRSDDVDDYYLNQREREDRDFDRILRNNRALNAAVNDITDAWKSRDIQLLARHTRPDSSIAVYLRGKYQYSLPGVDYLDMTRDAYRVSQTVRFRLDRIERKDGGVYLVSGRHSYRDKDDEERTVYVNYVLERGNDDEFYITQVGSSPDKLNDEE